MLSGEYATLYMLFRLRYPGILADAQVNWGSALSIVFNTASHFHFNNHRLKVSLNVISVILIYDFSLILSEARYISICTHIMH